MCVALPYVALAVTAMLVIFSWPFSFLIFTGIFSARNFLAARQNYQEAEKLLVKIRKEKGDE